MQKIILLKAVKKSGSMGLILVMFFFFVSVPDSWADFYFLPSGAIENIPVEGVESDVEAPPVYAIPLSAVNRVPFGTRYSGISSKEMSSASRSLRPAELALKWKDNLFAKGAALCGGKENFIKLKLSLLNQELIDAEQDASKRSYQASSMKIEKSGEDYKLVSSNIKDYDLVRYPKEFTWYPNFRGCRDAVAAVVISAPLLAAGLTTGLSYLADTWSGRDLEILWGIYGGMSSCSTVVYGIAKYLSWRNVRNLPGLPYASPLLITEAWCKQGHELSEEKVDL